MRKTSFLLLTASMGIALACSEHLPTSPDNFVQRGVWGSNQASLSIKETSATLQILNGSCYGSFGDIDQPIPSGHFALPGNYTQFTGVYPGEIQYTAQYSGTVEGNQLTMTVTVPALQRTFGPFSLTYGVDTTTSPCRYP